MSHNLEHQKVHTRMVKEVLKAVARACRRFDLYETEAEMKADDPKWW
ncbi:Hypothetical protein Asd1617_06341 (plasmid) [Shigella dysenteriae 1617]|uniref:Uncharacterized protein n=1 Tax=Shigella dysenteriae 1617 TaxID=754093 RepID=A0A0A7A489_SHIDY|nr:Hypothetical protein Asd1617_06341 [Shigella dysenteriae 1617]